MIRTTAPKPKFVFPLACLLLGLLVAIPASAVTLKIATLSPDGTYWMKMLRQGADEISRKTDGRVRFKFYPGGVMGDENSIMRKIRIGQLQGGAVTSLSLAGSFEGIRVYSMPIIFNSLEEVDYVRRRMDPILVEGMRAGGFVTFGLAEGGFAYLMSKEPISNIPELRKHKVWVPENDYVAIETARAFGVSPVPLSVSEVRTALQTGLIDTVAISPIAAIALRWHTEINFITDTPLIYLHAVLAIDRRAFDRVPAEDQATVIEVMQRVWKAIDQKNRKDNIAALEALRGQGVRFVEPDPAERRQWKQIAARVPERLIDSGKISREFVQQMEAILQDYRDNARKTADESG